MLLASFEIIEKAVIVGYYNEKKEGKSLLFKE